MTNPIDPMASVAYDVGSVIPESAIHQWPMDEGSGSTVDDGIGSANGSFVDNPTWVSDPDAVGGYRVSFDGSNDRIDYTVDISQYSEWMYSFTIQADTPLGNEDAFYWGEDGSYGEARCGQDPIQFSVGDGSSANPVVASSDVYDGAKHRVSCYLIEGDQTGIAVDGTIEDTASFGTMGPISSDLYSAFFGRGGSYAALDKDNPIIYTDTSQSTIDGDLDAQPWS